MQCNPSVKQCKRHNGSLEHAKFQIKILLPSDSNIDTKTSNLFTNNSNAGINNCYKKHRYKNNKECRNCLVNFESNYNNNEEPVKV